MSFPNVIQGAYATPYEVGTVALYPLGQRMETPNGRVFRYAEMGTTVGIANKLYQSEVPGPNFDTLDVPTAVVVGDTSITATNGTTAIVENDFQYGYLIFEETANLGECHRLAGNTGVGAGSVVTCYLFQGDSFQVAMDASSDKITLVKNPYKDIIIKPETTQTAMPVGVPPMLIAASGYGWVQTHGVASCLIEGTVVIGYEGRPSEESSGNGGVGALTAQDYDEANDANLGSICRIIEVAPTTDFCTVFLTLEGLG